MKKEELKKLQNELDLAKWNDSQKLGGVDACGSYAFCVKCDKNMEYPCAKAKVAFEKPVSEKMVRMRKPRAKKAQ